MSDDDTASPKYVRELIRSGQLPRHRPNDVWAGRSSGQERCAVCGYLVDPHQVVMEGEFRDPDRSSILYFHGRCFWIVDSEWRRVEPASDSTGAREGSGVGADSDPKLPLERKSG
jgi:hypothetical protein